MAHAARHRIDDIAAFLRRQDWIGEVFAGPELAAVGNRPDTPLAIALTTRHSDSANPYGVAGMCPVIADPLSGETSLGCGQHGGLGRYEQRPFLMVRGGGFRPATRVETPSSPVDIAPTILRHLGLPDDGMDGMALSRD